MNADPIARLRALAADEGRALDELLRLHALEGILRRARVAEERLVLRGSLVTRHFAGALRPVEDVDFVARIPFDPAATAEIIGEISRAPCADGLTFALDHTEIIWAETAFPGVRARLLVSAGDARFPIQLDIGFGDPLVPGPAHLDLATLLPDLGARVLACRPETLFGWKVHGLFERGPGRWRPKDLFDLLLLADHAPLDPDALRAALRSAFETRGDPLALTGKLLAGTFGTSPWSRRKWASFRASRPAGQVPEDPAEVIAEVAAVLRPILAPMLTAS